jgi:large repetitive protein
VIGGFPDGTFKPAQQVSRQQFAKMIVLALGYPVSLADRAPFRDVSASLDSGDPLYPSHYVAVCAAHNITQGKRPGEFAPYENMTRAQLITMVARAASLPEPTAGFTPMFANFSPDHYPWARRAAGAGLLNGLAGMGPGYDFFAQATRGEVCVLLYNLLH